jgi:hypothetical protein
MKPILPKLRIGLREVIPAAVPDPQPSAQTLGVVTGGEVINYCRLASNPLDGCHTNEPGTEETE